MIEKNFDQRWELRYGLKICEFENEIIRATVVIDILDAAFMRRGRCLIVAGKFT
jgi:hypothetical protein